MAKGKSKTKKAKPKQVKKTNTTFALIAVIAFVVVAAMLYFGFISGKPNIAPINNNQPTASPFIPAQTASGGGLCQRDNQCFITHCKGYASSCINTTELSSYGKNCKNYLDWIIDMQDSAKCGCVLGSCTLK